MSYATSRGESGWGGTYDFSGAEVGAAPGGGVGGAAVETASADAVAEFGGCVVCVDDAAQGRGRAGAGCAGDAGLRVGVGVHLCGGVAAVGVVVRGGVLGVHGGDGHGMWVGVLVGVGVVRVVDVVWRGWGRVGAVEVAATAWGGGVGMAGGKGGVGVEVWLVMGVGHVGWRGGAAEGDGWG